MTVSVTTVKQLYEGDGATVKFAIPFPFFQTTDVTVYLRDNSVDPYTVTLLTNAVEYNLVDVVDGLPTNVEMVVAPTDNSGSVGEQLLVKRDVPSTQEITPTESAVEEMGDRAVMDIQELDEEFNRAILLDDTSSLSGITLPEGDNQYIKWNVGGTALEVDDIDLSTLESDIASNTANIAINTGDILANTAAIAGNTIDIAQNAVNIAAVNGDIAANTIDIAANLALINQNIADIAALSVLVNQNIADVGRLGTFGSQEVLNNQAAPLDITDFLFDGATHGSVRIAFEIRRETDSNNKHSTGTLALIWRNSNVWEVDRGLTVFDYDGLTFDVVSAGTTGQVNYVTDNLVGTSYVGKLTYKIEKFEV